MWDFIVEMGGPLVFPFFVTGIAYYIVEILIPYADQKKEFERVCIEKNGMVYEVRGKPTICIKKEIIKIK